MALSNWRVGLPVSMFLDGDARVPFWLNPDTRLRPAQRILAETKVLARRLSQLLSNSGAKMADSGSGLNECQVRNLEIDGEDTDLMRDPVQVPVKGRLFPRQRKALIAGAAGVLIFVAGVALGGVIDFGGLDSPLGSISGSSSESLPFAAAKKSCAPHSAFVVVGDEGRTLTVRGQGKEDAGLPIASIACLLTELGTPDSVVAEMDSTRALDGRRSGHWGDIRANWSYHPSSGMNLVFTVAD
ncbi:hypothetical protein JMF97_03735 [Micromonospora fiedleri]|uniref:Uncharacterized protein n=1 Tax=Micromonospora fiedleri TaxID=1157498 RepID=A0ABS1UIU5_9ACTN|nr:hypothetical protein [Micromonospora fiedleri]MBL6275271.1 hypothetical protein [Micromonospora fiedleri]